LQVEAYRHFKFQPTATLQMAQTLYEASMISYPRTSSQKLPAKLGLQKIIAELGKQEQYAPLANELVQKKLFVPFEGKKEDPAHPAIHPTGQKGDLGERERKLYDLIVKRFLSCFAPAAKRESQSVMAKCNTQNYKSGGARTLEKGWLVFYEPYAKFEEVTLPNWQEGQAVEANDFRMDEKKTQPPKRLTPASVISELEEADLGTKATRAVVVDTLFKRGYLKGSSSIEVTAFGMSVIDIMAKYSPEILDEELTRKIEKEMDAITEGHIHKDAVINDGRKIIEQITGHFKEREKAIGDELAMALMGARSEANLVGACPKCEGGDLRVIRSKFGKNFVGCSNYPKCTNTYQLPQLAKIEPLGTKCEKCGTPQVKVIRAKQSPFTMCLDFYCPTKTDTRQTSSVVMESENEKTAQQKTSVAPSAAYSPAGKTAIPPASPSTSSPMPSSFAKKTVQVGDITLVKEPPKAKQPPQPLQEKPAVPTLVTSPKKAPKAAVYSRKAAEEEKEMAAPAASLAAVKKKAAAKKKTPSKKQK